MKPTAWEALQQDLRATPGNWLVTGVAGFIGSHLLETLLALGQRVLGLDNFSTGKRVNLAAVEASVGAQNWSRFRLVEGDLSDRDVCLELCSKGPRVLHQAALGSVPRSLKDPAASFANNVTGFFHLLDAARRGGAQALVYASSSSVYGDSPELPRREQCLGELLSPYAATKRIDELMAQTAQRCYGQPSIGLRYFNVFGPRQDSEGPYSAVIPRWAQELLAGEQPTLHGDGSTSRDFCPVSCVVQANLLAAMAGPEVQGRVFNVALGRSLTLGQLYRAMAQLLGHPEAELPRSAAFRPGDVLHSQADLGAIHAALGYAPQEDFEDGLARTLHWYGGGDQYRAGHFVDFN